MPHIFNHSLHFKLVDVSMSDTDTPHTRVTPTLPRYVSDTYATWRVHFFFNLIGHIGGHITNTHVLSPDMHVRGHVHICF